MHNPMCDGSHCRHETGTVKLYATGGGGNMIYCVACWFHENDYRRRRGIETKNPEGWPQLSWDTAEVYQPEEAEEQEPNDEEDRERQRLYEKYGDERLRG